LSGWLPVSMQVVDDEQPSAPVWHGFVGVHAAELTHAPQVPEAHTWPVPHGVPSVTGPIATHVWLPVEQSVRPWTQAPADGVHGWFALQDTQTPTWQTASVPQLAPSASAVGEAVQAPVAQLIVPLKHGVAVGTQSARSVQATQLPAELQMFPAPQDCPAGTFATWMQSGCPVEQSVP
jgi:hypothetical protein